MWEDWLSWNRESTEEILLTSQSVPPQIQRTEDNDRGRRRRSLAPPPSPVLSSVDHNIWRLDNISLKISRSASPLRNSIHISLRHAAGLSLSFDPVIQPRNLMERPSDWVAEPASKHASVLVRRSSSDPHREVQRSQVVVGNTYDPIEAAYSLEGIAGPSGSGTSQE